MNHIESTVDDQEVSKFAQHAGDWWDLNGPLKTLHDINPARLEFIRQHITLDSSRILDVGCGGGILSSAMVKAGAEVVGIDAESHAIEAAKTHAQNNNLQVDFIATPIEEYDSQPFDAVTCMEMLEHVQNPELVLEHCKRLLKPEGILMVSTISRTMKAYASAILAAEYVLGLLPRQTHDYAKFILPSELAAIARQVGLSLVDLQGMSYNPITGRASLTPDVSVNYLMAFSVI